MIHLEQDSLAKNNSRKSFANPAFGCFQTFKTSTTNIVPQKHQRTRQLLGLQTALFGKTMSLFFYVSFASRKDSHADFKRSFFLSERAAL